MFFFSGPRELKFDGNWAVVKDSNFWISDYYAANV